MKWSLGIHYNRVFIENTCNSMMAAFMNHAKHIHDSSLPYHLIIRIFGNESYLYSVVHVHITRMVT